MRSSSHQSMRDPRRPAAGTWIEPLAGIPAISALALVLALASPLWAVGIQGVATLEGYSVPGHEGYWLYALDITWDTSKMENHGMSFLNFFLDLGVCDCACDLGMVVFPEPAGVGVGEDGCDLSFVGIYDCHGDPHFPELGASIKFEPLPSGCEPGPIGSARVRFRSLFGPSEHAIYNDVLGIKASTRTLTGSLVGVLPVCDCGSPVEGASWGVLKAIYR